MFHVHKQPDSWRVDQAGSRCEEERSHVEDTRYMDTAQTCANLHRPSKGKCLRLRVCPRCPEHTSRCLFHYECDAEDTWGRRCGLATQSPPKFRAARGPISTAVLITYCMPFVIAAAVTEQKEDFYQILEYRWSLNVYASLSLCDNRWPYHRLSSLRNPRLRRRLGTDPSLAPGHEQDKSWDGAHPRNLSTNFAE